MPSTIATTGDSVIRMHRNVGEGARSAAAGLPTASAEGMRAGHAAILEGALAETRKSLEELARVASVGAGGAEALSGQDSESGRKFGGVREVRRG
ncbi:Uncharacterised protein [Mycobacteroides abscessus subsp. abscessus]|uniref:Uncharacterized protein n=1 Tax=Mycobacteroides abscessus subsp. bolletii TaxID=319705 RepID=A0A9Q7SHI8_9MYCO|nr:hypothetical protein [Mycobacteroides abscessus]SHU55338.1 Uncharacterised protein [Mycobacteroides abscessus subsp. bolletii]SHU73553.1 Uncharacterised protein [Mycobacteroides abscessus subsp. bolletii]SHX83590.1 Uncharacterised protein [Mycobacteroides abscessus subsp. bolletii]SID82539.1 Uncharacterised protein [Mycobacteroides abscessus subsp. abscessus]SIF85374.1 Uncharacterised protein [Mycobacteroides abscessus subsp. abscessus]